MSGDAVIQVAIVAVPETAGSALYGMVDVLLAAGNIWQTLVRANSQQSLFTVKIVSADGKPFQCGNGIPVSPDCAMAASGNNAIIILPEGETEKKKINPIIPVSANSSITIL